MLFLSLIYISSIVCVHAYSFSSGSHREFLISWPTPVSPWASLLFYICLLVLVCHPAIKCYTCSYHKISFTSFDGCKENFIFVPAWTAAIKSASLTTRKHEPSWQLLQFTTFTQTHQILKIFAFNTPIFLLEREGNDCRWVYKITFVRAHIPTILSPFSCSRQCDEETWACWAANEMCEPACAPEVSWRWRASCFADVCVDAAWGVH